MVAISRMCRSAAWIGLLWLVASALMSACDIDGGKPGPSPSGESVANNPALLLSRLPPDSSLFVFAEIEMLLRRPVMRQEVEYGFDELSKRTYGLIGSELLASEKIESLAYAMTNDENASATILGILCDSAELVIHLLFEFRYDLGQFFANVSLGTSL